MIEPFGSKFFLWSGVITLMIAGAYALIGISGWDAVIYAGGGQLTAGGVLYLIGDRT